MDEQTRKAIQQQINELQKKATSATTGNVAAFGATLLAAHMQTLLSQAEATQEPSTKTRIEIDPAVELEIEEIEDIF